MFFCRDWLELHQWPENKEGGLNCNRWSTGLWQARVPNALTSCSDGWLQRHHDTLPHGWGLSKRGACQVCPPSTLGSRVLPPDPPRLEAVCSRLTLQATPGVRLRVTAAPKDPAEPAVVFSNGPEESRPSLAFVNRGDWTTMNVTLPRDGLSNASFSFFVPLGYDDLSAAVTMVLWEGQELPVAPPPPVGAVCA